jgi:hypothetical protein
VQGAVERLVAELADRLRGAPAVEGVAIVLPHDGWLHVPGVAWGLDDATFARFVADAGADVEQIARPVLAVADSDGRRFAGRAALVEGPLKDRWLTWREGVVAGFYGRLADVIAARQPAWNLYVTPTTLFVAGDLASRFQPLLAGEPEDVDLLRAVAIEPGRIAAHGRIVYVAPHVHGAIDDVVERGVLHGANRSLPLLRGAARAARNGAVLVERPCELDVKPLVAQGAFSAATAEPAAVHAPAAGVGRGEPLAATCIASDIEVVFDMALMHRRVDEDDAVRRRAFESLPAAALEIVGQAPAPLVVRVRTGESGTWVSLVNVCGTACQAVLECDAVPSGVYDAVTKDALPVGPTGEVMAGLGAWEMKTIVVEGECKVVAARVVFEPGVRDRLKDRLAELHRRRAALEMPAPLAVLDNPTFDLPELGGMVPGWELLEPRRGTFGPVAGKPSAGGKGAVFASANGLATLRSNPFPPPATGRISIAMWVRIAEGSPQPPLRIAIEGVRDDREYYRFAPVGRGAGAMPLTATWAQFVLQVDDLPTRGIESLRVRLDLLGPGSVEIDDVRVFDLAFEESQRVQLSRLLAVADERFVAGDIGGCLVDVESHWPRFLEDFVAPAMPDAPASTDPATASAAGGSKPEEAAQPQRTGVMDRVRRWWQ